MKTFWKVLLGSMFLSGLVLSYGYYLNGQIILSIAPAAFPVLGFLLIGSYYATRWWIRSIKRDLEARDLQKSVQNKKKKTE